MTFFVSHSRLHSDHDDQRERRRHQAGEHRRQWRLGHPPKPSSVQGPLGGRSEQVFAFSADGAVKRGEGSSAVGRGGIENGKNFSDTANLAFTVFFFK